MQTAEITTPLGTMLAAATGDGLCLLEFTDSNRVKAQSDKVRKLLGAETVNGKNSHLEELKRQLDEYFAGKRKIFDLSLVLAGTPFQRAVWQTLRTIPYGKTISYKEEAQRIGRPTAIRAVARANGANPISIVIPCHRVIGKNGNLVGYGGGLGRKQWLLDLERGHVG
jgi:AraC family transcriptional regulator of adaptative response/methylated-DNA-[protein]-cysteine methyltransferase